MGMIEKFQQDLRDGMPLEDALQKHHLTLKEAIDYVHKPITHSPHRKKPQTKRDVYKKVSRNISQKNNAYHVRKHINSKSFWGGSYDTLEDARKIRDYLDEYGWNPIKVNEACKQLGIERRRR